MAHPIRLPDGREVDLDHFVEWRPWLWRRPVKEALAFLAPLEGKRILEVGGRRAKMACLFALHGAEVTMLERHLPPEAQAEVARWDIADRVRLVETDGTFDAVAGERFDAVFTKSVLWSIEDLGPFLDALLAHLKSDSRAAFVENYRGGGALMWLRNHVLNRQARLWSHSYHGIRKNQLPLFRDRLEDVRIRRWRCFVYTIFGRGPDSA